MKNQTIQVPEKFDQRNSGQVITEPLDEVEEMPFVNTKYD